MKVKYSITITSTERRPKFRMSFSTEISYIPQVGMQFNLLNRVENSRHVNIETIGASLYTDYYEARLTLVVTKDKPSLLELREELLKLGWVDEQTYE